MNYLTLVPYVFVVAFASSTYYFSNEVSSLKLSAQKLQTEVAEQQAKAQQEAAEKANSVIQVATTLGEALRNDDQKQAALTAAKLPDTAFIRGSCPATDKRLRDANATANLSAITVASALDDANDKAASTERHERAAQEFARRAYSISADGDRAIEMLNACQAYVDEVRK